MRVNIALTGGIGSGKSCVASILGNALAYPVVSADVLCRDLMEHGAEGWRAVRERWAGRFFKPDTTLDRALLKEAVFNDDDLRHELEGILHPLIRFAVKERMAAAEKAGEGLVVEVPLLFEVGWQDDFSCTVAVFAPVTLCLQRVSERDGINREQVQKVLAAQMPPLLKAEKAMFVIDNSGLWVQTVQQVTRLARQLPKYIDQGGNPGSFNN